MYSLNALHYLSDLAKTKDVVCQLCRHYACKWIHYNSLDYGYCERCYRIFSHIEPLDLKQYKRKLKKFHIIYYIKTRDEYYQMETVSRILTGKSLEELTHFLHTEEIRIIQERIDKEAERKEKKRQVIIDSFPAF